jgi:glycosyltransferase involved in cell wall biosynthesis
MKKIIFSALSGFASADTGGPNKIIYQILCGLEKNKFRAFYLSKNIFTEINSTSSYLSKVRQDKLKIKQNLFSKSKFYRELFTSSLYLKYFFYTAIKNITDILEQKEWDILHAHDVRSLFGLKNKKGKVILTIHSKGSIVNDMIQIYGKRKSLKNILEKFSRLEVQAIEKADILTFPSFSSRELFFEETKSNISLNKTKIIYNGIDVNKIQSITIDELFLKKWSWLLNYDYKILTVGAHIKAKNIDKILVVFSHLQKMEREKSFLVCVGSGPLTRELKNFARLIGVEEKVLFINFLSNDDIIKLMKICNIYISLSSKVIFDIVILEALACGMNVFASDDGGNREIVNEKNGVLVKLDDLKSIAELIRNSRYERNSEAINSIRHYSIDEMIKNYSSLYE